MQFEFKIISNNELGPSLYWWVDAFQHVFLSVTP